MQTGVSTACLYPMELEKSFYQLASNGIKNTEIFVNTHCELSDPYLSLMLDIQREYDMTVTSIHPYTCPAEPIMLFTDYERRFSDSMEYMKLYFDYMNKFGAKIFVLHGNKPQNPFPMQKYFERFARMQELANSFGITIAQENVSRCSAGQLEFLTNMKKYLGDIAKFVLDTKQAHRVGGNPMEFLDVLGESVVHVHFSDYSEKQDCMAYKDGTYNNAALFSKLNNLGYNGCIMLELYKHNYTNLKYLADNYRLLKHDLQFFSNSDVAV